MIENCKDKIYNGFFEIYFCSARKDVIIDCESQIKQYGCPNELRQGGE